MGSLHLLNTSVEEKLGHAYFYAKSKVIKEGYLPEIETQEKITFAEVDLNFFIRETAWVILNAGMKEKVIRKVWPEISSAFLFWNNSEDIIAERKKCIHNALKYFNHKKKIHSIADSISYVYEVGFDNFKKIILSEGVNSLEELPYIGKITKYHLAKNIGLNYSKPDRHLQRISDRLSFDSVHEMCKTISNKTYDKENVIDLVIWRYATLHPDYLHKIKYYF